MANAKHILDKAKEIQKLADGIATACQALINHPDITEITDFANMLQAFANGQPNPVAKPAQTRTRRTKAEIEAEKAAKDFGK